MNPLFIILLMLLSVSVQSQQFDLLQPAFDKSLPLKDSHYGFYLYDLDSNQFLYSINESKHFTPASNAKVFTLHHALANLGDSIPGLHYIIRGDSLIFWGTADPTFLHHKLDSRRVYHFLKNTDKQIFYAVDDTKDETFYRRGWAIEDYQESYQPEISSFPIYGNVVQFKEDHTKLIADPPMFQNALGIEESEEQKFKIFRKYDNNQFSINSLVVPHRYIGYKPFIYDDEIFLQLLADTIKKDIKQVYIEKPTDFKVLYSVDTYAVLQEMVLSSDNFIAEQLYMLIALSRSSTFKTAALRQEMKGYYAASFTDKIALHDASGLSFYNKVTPRAMVELLLLIAKQVPEESLRHGLFPTGAMSGTLKNTYALDRSEAFVWAKTGTISSVYAQSGYLTTRTGRNLVFSFLVNNFLGSAVPVRKEMVNIITFIRHNY